MNTFLPSIALTAMLAIAPAQPHQLASHQISLENRYPVESVSQVFKKNILLNMAYLNGKTTKGERVDWEEVEKPFQYQFVLDPGQTFAFHDGVLTKYKGKVTKTTNAHFSSTEGFISDGYLIGDGVCHLASLMKWVAVDAGLEVEAPHNHDFAAIPEIDKKYGVGIFNQTGNDQDPGEANLYITNNKEHPITFTFDYKDNNLSLKVEETQ